MRNFILFLLLICGVSLAAQPTLYDIKQIKTLPASHFFGSNGTNNVPIEAIAANIGITAPTGYSATDQQAFNDEIATNLDAVAAGAADGVITGGTHDVANDELDFSADAPATPFSVDISALVKDTELIDNSDTNEAQSLTSTGTTDPTLSLSQANGAGGGDVIFEGTGATSVVRSGNTFTFNSVDNVDDADASVTNEIQEPTETANSNEIGLTQTAVKIDRSDYMVTETFRPTSGSSISLSASPNADKDLTVTLNGQVLYFERPGGGTPDLGLSGTNISFNFWTFTAAAEDVVEVKYPN